MAQIVEKEFHLNLYYIIFLIMFIPILYIINISGNFIYIAAMLGFIFNAFYYDSKNHVNRFTASLPLKRESIVLGKYIFFLISTAAFLLYIWLVDKIAHSGLPYLESKPLNWFVILLIFTSIAVMLSISIPIYFMFQSYMKAFFIQMILLFSVIFSIAIIIGNPYIQISEKMVLFILDIIHLQPVLILIGFSLGSLYLSYRLTAWSYIKKDIV